MNQNQEEEKDAGHGGGVAGGLRHHVHLAHRQPAVGVVEHGLLRLALAGGLQLLDPLHLQAAPAPVVVDGLLPHQVLGAGDAELAAEHRLAGQLAVLQRLVDEDVKAGVVRRNDEGVLKEGKGAPGELDVGHRVDAAELAAHVDPGAAVNPLLLEAGGRGGGVDQHVRLLHRLGLQAGDFAGVGAGHVEGGAVEEEGPVAGVVAAAPRVVEVNLALEPVVDELGHTVGQPGDPLEEGGRLVVKVPLDLEADLLGDVVVVVAVEDHVLGAHLHRGGDPQLVDLDRAGQTDGHDEENKAVHVVGWCWCCCCVR